MENVAPLPHEYMIVGIIGLFISLFLITDKTWNFALSLFFLLLIIASLVSLTGDTLDERTLGIIGGEPYQRKTRKTLKR